ncbi:MAG: polyprenyl synthetase family protein, partial [Actinobacteria bacterium]|nr:polyprenyl synthetase family protein [Actinomycetota bacterium]
MYRSPEDLRTLVEGYLAELAFTPELGGLEDALRYPLESGGKRVRPVIALAVA